MFKKISLLIAIFTILNTFNSVAAEIIPIKKPAQTKEEKQKKLLVDVLRPLPKPILKKETKSEKKEIELKKPKIAGIILPKKKPIIAGTKTMYKTNYLFLEASQ